MGRPKCPERERARVEERQTYRTGKLCKRGHQAPRYVRGSRCTACVREDSEKRGRWDPATWRTLKRAFLERVPSFREAFPDVG